MRMRIFFTTLELLFFVFSSVWAFPNPPRVLKVGNYTFEITEMLAWDSKDEKGKSVESLHIYLTITRGESEIKFHEQGNFYFFGDPDDPQNANLTNGTDLTGDGEPDVVIAERGYDSKEDLRFWIFSVGKDFKLLGKVPAAYDDVPSFRDGKIKEALAKGLPDE